MWVKKEMPVVKGYESLGDNVRAKRWLDFRLNELLDIDDPVLEYAHKLRTIKEIAEFVITQVDYPLKFGKPTDKHYNNWFGGLCCHKITEDFWQRASETLRTVNLNKKYGKKGYGDCLTGDTKIITVRDGRYNLESLNELRRYGWEGVKVLTYDFSKNEWTFRPITNFYDKGVRDTWEVTLRNGTSFRVADKHKMYVIKKSYSMNPNNHLYAKMPYYIDLMYFDDFRERWHKAKQKCAYQLPLAKKIPALGTVDVNKSELYIEGHYAAEGWKEGGHVATSGDIRKVKNHADKLRIPYSITKNNNSVPELFFKASYMKDRLENMGRQAFDKHFLYDRLSLSESGIKALLEGYNDGDGYIEPKRKLPSGRRQDSVEVIYNTSSDKLAEQLCFMTRILGKYFYKWHQLHHQGAGKKPIWRIYVYRKMKTWKNITPYLVNMSVKSIEYQGRERVYDIEVADTHNFVLADSGILVHNCEDTSILFTTLMLQNDFNAYEIFGAVYRGDDLLGGHGFAIFEDENGIWRLYESTLDIPPSYPDGYPKIDPQSNEWNVGDITYVGYIKFNRKEYYEWETEGISLGMDAYLDLSFKEKETRYKYEALQYHWDLPVTPIVRTNWLSKLRWRR